ncbi:unnamed protein product, partial [Ectocarpus sp. 12 AP-2014]
SINCCWCSSIRSRRTLTAPGALAELRRPPDETRRHSCTSLRLSSEFNYTSIGTVSLPTGSISSIAWWVESFPPFVCACRLSPHDDSQSGGYNTPRSWLEPQTIVCGVCGVGGTRV